MRAVTKITFWDDNGNKFFGEGPACLLRAVEETGSLRGAAMSMGMAYTKALRILKQAEESLGIMLTARAVGGRSGGGSCLTVEGKEWLQRYEAYRDACKEANQQLFQEYFLDQVSRKTGCVIMASGLGKRFGANKLLADFKGEPMICRILQTTEGIFAQRVVVTRHAEIAHLCKQRGISVILHDMPHRSDTVRLGLEAMKGVEHCMFCPADQPLLTKGTVAALVRASEKDGEMIWRTACGDVQGSPVVFPAWTFPELMTLPEGKGGGAVIQRYPQHLRLMEVRDPYELKDVDVPEDLEDMAKR